MFCRKHYYYRQKGSVPVKHYTQGIKFSLQKRVDKIKKNILNTSYEASKVLAKEAMELRLASEIKDKISK